MTTSTLIPPTHKAIKTYHAELQEISIQSDLEGAVSAAFHRLLADTARTRGWTLVGQQDIKLNGKTVRPDGTLRDEWKLPHGYWEAKDTHDDLDTEIRKKIARGYPLSNIIFEDTRQAVLYQHGQEAYRADMHKPDELARLLSWFYGYEAPHVEEFKQAVAHFQQEIPALAGGLNERIKQAHAKNKRFQEAFGGFFELCKASLNPNISRDAVDEMLIQHLLTERLIRRVFDMEEFTQRNVIAAEIEKVIGALTSAHFSRTDFLGALDRFYGAIEAAADDLADFHEKQQFLNTVYERFFQGYSVKVADTHGIVYTPPEIVEFMCAGVEEVLREEFGVGLGDAGVNILDPCTGTGNFIVHLMQRIPRKDLPRVYGSQLFANEVMLLPYYIAALNIEHAYYETTDSYQPFEGLCFVDTLDMAESAQMRMSFMTARNTERVERQKQSPITVILGNPPYNVGQLNENDNNRNRKYEIVDQRVSETYAKDSRATSRTKINDPYVKFFRWATDRLQGHDGVVCFVSNNSFVDQIAYDGMRKHLQEAFSRIYVLDLRGNIRKDSMRDGIPLGEKHTVFGSAAMVGVSITLLVRKRAENNSQVYYSSVPMRSTREEKFALLAKASSHQSIEWNLLRPDSHYTWLVPEHNDEFQSLIPLGTREAKSAKTFNVDTVFKVFSLGVATNRDQYVYSFDVEELGRRCQTFVEVYNAAVDKLKRRGSSIEFDELTDSKDTRIKWTRQVKASLRNLQGSDFDWARIRRALYRPFLKTNLYYDGFWNEEPRLFARIFPNPAIEQENLALCGTGIGAEKPFAVSITNCIPDLNFYGPGTVPQWFPFYIYNTDGSNRRENITDWALRQFQEHYQDKSIGKWDIFYYVYGLLHHPAYRAKYADNLKRELPRILLASDFRAFSRAGQALAELHLGYEQAEPWKLTWIEDKETPLSYHVEKMRLSKDKSTLAVNPSLTLAGIPPEALDYRLGNRSALEWVIDQYRIKTDERSGITSDPNNPDDEQYIVRLVGQVVRVSVETVKIVKSLPEAFGG